MRLVYYTTDSVGHLSSFQQRNYELHRAIPKSLAHKDSQPLPVGDSWNETAVHNDLKSSQTLIIALHARLGKRSLCYQHGRLPALAWGVGERGAAPEFPGSAEIRNNLSSCD